VWGNAMLAQSGGAYNCSAFAAGDTDNCLPFTSICVGHESLIKGVCTGARDLFIEQLHALFARLNLDAFHMAQGDAKLVDDDGDGIADRIIEGKWDSEMNIGLGMRKAPATFSAARTSTTASAN